MASMIIRHPRHHAIILHGDEAMLLTILCDSCQFMSCISLRSSPLPWIVHASEMTLGQECLDKSLGWTNIHAHANYLAGGDSVALVEHLAIFISVSILMNLQVHLRANDKHISDFHLHTISQG